MLLEIISGKKNKGFYNSDRDHNRLQCVSLKPLKFDCVAHSKSMTMSLRIDSTFMHRCGAGRNWKKGQGLAIVDMVIKDSSSPTFRPREILRRLQIGLLCVQSRVDDRPLMSAVVLMLGSEAVDIPQPNPPGYCVI